MRIKVIGLDVWGHAPDDCEEEGGCDCGGWYVNDRFRLGEIYVPDTAPDIAILKILEEEQFIHADKCVLEDADGSFLEVLSKKTGKPLLHLEILE